MATGIFQSMPVVGSNWGFIVKIALFSLLALVIGLLLGFGVYIFIIKSKQKTLLEINMVTRKIRNLIGVEKRNKSHKKQLYIKKLRKFLPSLQQEDTYLNKNKDTVFLLKDNNGLYHTARLPKMEELVKWYKVVHDIDLTEEVKKIQETETEEERLTIIDKLKDTVKGIKRKNALKCLETVYLIPNPTEDIEWLANEQNMALSTFGTGILKHPALVWIGTLTLCALTFIITIVVTKMA